MKVSIKDLRVGDIFITALNEICIVYETTKDVVKFSTDCYYSPLSSQYFISSDSKYGSIPHKVEIICRGVT